MRVASRLRPALGILAICGGSLLLAAPPPSDASNEEHVRLPLTLEKVWFRSQKGKSPIRLFNTKDDLTIREDGMAFHTDKESVEIPLERIRVVSYGKTRGDVDTEWTLLGIGDERLETVLAIRDGSKLGYGQRSWEIYRTIRRALRSLRAAQYAMPEGFEVFDDFDLHFTIGIPTGWHSYIDSVVIVGNRASQGTVVFSEEPLRRDVAAAGERSRPKTDEAALARALSGETPAFFVERLAAGRGMTCDQVSDKARRRVLEQAAAGELFHGGGKFVALPTVTPIVVDRCKGLRLRGRVADHEGVTTEVDLHGVVQGETLYVFGLRAIPERYDEYRKVLEGALDTVTLSVAR
jgi:hypothetical protein